MFFGNRNGDLHHEPDAENRGLARWFPAGEQSIEIVDAGDDFEEYHPRPILKLLFVGGFLLFGILMAINVWTGGSGQERRTENSLYRVTRSAIRSEGEYERQLNELETNNLQLELEENENQARLETLREEQQLLLEQSSLNSQIAASGIATDIANIEARNAQIRSDSAANTVEIDRLKGMADVRRRELENEQLAAEIAILEEEGIAAAEAAQAEARTAQAEAEAKLAQALHDQNVAEMKQQRLELQTMLLQAGYWIIGAGVLAFSGVALAALLKSALFIRDQILTFLPKTSVPQFVSGLFELLFRLSPNKQGAPSSRKPKGPQSKNGGGSSGIGNGGGGNSPKPKTPKPSPHSKHLPTSGKNYNPAKRTPESRAPSRPSRTLDRKKPTVMKPESSGEKPKGKQPPPPKINMPQNSGNSGNSQNSPEFEPGKPYLNKKGKRVDGLVTQYLKQEQADLIPLTQSVLKDFDGKFPFWVFGAAERIINNHKKEGWGIKKVQHAFGIPGKLFGQLRVGVDARQKARTILSSEPDKEAAVVVQPC